jgi:hypothetical protein
MGFTGYAWHLVEIYGMLGKDVVFHSLRLQSEHGINTHPENRVILIRQTTLTSRKRRFEEKKLISCGWTWFFNGNSRLCSRIKKYILTRSGSYNVSVRYSK